MSSVSYKWKKKDRKRSRKPYDRPFNEQPWYLKYKLESYLPNWVVNVKNYFLTNVASESDENNINEENGGFSGSLLDSRPVRVIGDEGENEENEDVDDEEEEEDEEEEDEDAEDAEEVEEEEELEDKLDVPDTEEEEEVVVEEPPKPPVKETSKFDFKVTLNKMDKSNNLGKSELPGNSKISTATAQRFSGKRKLELGPITTPTPSTSRGIANEVRDEEGSSSSENTASSTSGCSSLVPSSNYLQKLSLPLDKNKTERLRKELLKSTRDVAVETDNKPSLNNRDESRRSLLWSHSPSSRFNVSKFTSPTSVLPRLANSPYYEGKTSFGGTSAKRARLAAPLNKLISPTNNTTNVKIQLNNRSSDSGKKVNSEDLLSDAAKRILANIEKISSPLEDAKKIPVFGSIDTSRYLSEPKRASTIRTPYARPVKSVPYPSLRASLVPIEKPQLKWAVSSSEAESVDRVDSTVTPQRDLGSSPSYGGFSSGDRNSGGSGGGKIRAKLRKNSGDSSKLYEKIQSPELPNVPFNITTLPSFSFAKASAVSTPVASPTLQKADDPSSLQKSKDVDGAAESRVKPTTTIEVIENESEKENKLKTDISLPVPLKEQSATLDTTSKLANASVIKGDNSESSNKVVQDEMVVPKSGSHKESTTVSQVAPSRSKISADAALAAIEGKMNDDSNQEIKIVESTSSSNTPAQSSKPLSKDSSSSSTVSDKSVGKSNVGKTSESLFSKFKPPPGSWMCEECFVQNKPADLKCIACETVKKGAMVPPTSTPSITSKGFSFPTAPVSSAGSSDDGFKSFALAASTTKPPEQSQSINFGSKPTTLRRSEDGKPQTSISSTSVATTPATTFTFGKPSTESNVSSTTPSLAVPASIFSSPSLATESSGFPFKPVEAISKPKDDSSKSLFNIVDTNKEQVAKDTEGSPAKRKLELTSDQDSSSDKPSDKPGSGMFTFGSDTPFSKSTFGVIGGEKSTLNFQFPKPPEDTPVKGKEVPSPSQLSNSNTSNCSMSVEVLDDNVSEDEKKKSNTTPKFSLFSTGSSSTPVSQPSTNLFSFAAKNTPTLTSNSSASEVTKTTSSGFTFGSDSNKSTTSGFTFGSSGNDATKLTPSSGFSFGKTAPIVTTPSTTSTPAGFIFGNAATESTVSVPKANTETNLSTSGSVFGRSTPTQGATIQPSTNAFAFNKPSTTSQSFKFTPTNAIGDGSSSSGQAKSGPVFTFGSSGPSASSFPLATTTQTASSTSNALSSSTPGGFSFGSSSTANSFSFASKPSTTTTMSSGFSFDLAKSNTSSAPSVTSAPSSSTASTFAFGSPSTAASTSTGGFNFGQTSTAASGSTTGFVFGSASNNAPSLVTPSIQSNSFGSFSFGASSSAPQSQAPAPAAASSNVFTFGSSASTNHTQPSLGASPAAPAINFETQPNFNFLNTAPTQGGQPFRFAAEASNSTGAVAVQRNFKKAKRRLPRA